MIKRLIPPRLFNIKIFDDDGRPMASIKKKKPRDLKDAVDKWFDKII